MSKGKEFFEYCVKNPEVLQKIRGIKNEEMEDYVKSLGFELGESDIRDFMELCAESDDEALASAVSGGSCGGHCGHRCEQDCRIDGDCGRTCECRIG